MNRYLLAASVLAAATGAAHSLLGELLVFRKLEPTRLPALTPFVLVRVARLAASEALAKATLRATWHTATAFGWGLAVVLGHEAVGGPLGAEAIWTIRVVATMFAVSSALFFAATRGRHPGWLLFLALAALVWLGAASRI